MLASDVAEVQASFLRCSEDVEFIDHFYQHFMESSAEVTALFAAVEMNHQAVMLRGSLELLLGASCQPGGERALQTVAALHSRQGIAISPALYDLWLSSLLATIKVHDRRCNAALLAAWERVLAPGIRFMKQAY